MRVGAIDQRPIEDRDDVLVFTSPPVEDDTEVTGPIVIKLYAASSAKDTDFTAKLIDVYPDGMAYNLTEGIIRARFRESIWDPPKLLVPGVIYEYTLELQSTSNVFLKGHSIRVHLSSSNFPLWDRNPNTGHDIGMDTKLQVAEQTIYHDRDHPSHIVLPVIPKRN
jgi:putative CocE/NonD family hydrolase